MTSTADSSQYLSPKLLGGKANKDLRQAEQHIKYDSVQRLVVHSVVVPTTDNQTLVALSENVITLERRGNKSERE